ncbi:MAG: hypothetical protein ACLP1Y_05915 [Candidatus Acidiferrales bacterium]
MRLRLASVVVPFALLLALAAPVRAADGTPEIFPLDQVKPGMTGTGQTIFAGDQIESFDFVVIGVMPNLIGPGQSIILVQLKGAKVEHTGVAAGMSGSPVYIDGKLLGAVSLKLGLFAKEPLAGVTPIEEMLSLPSTPPAAGVADASSVPRYPLPDSFSAEAGATGPVYLEPIASPLTFSGFSADAIRHYAADLSGYGLSATQGGTAAPSPDDANIAPGDMVGMVLVRGDLSIDAACTVTAVIGDRVLACGHPLFGFGPLELPMARARVLTTLASDYDSTKIVNMGGTIGSITDDRSAAVTGRLGKAPEMIPIEMTLATPAGEKKYHFEIVSNPKLAPVIIGLVTLNGLTQNPIYGEGSTLSLHGSIEIAGHSSVQMDDMFAPTETLIPDATFVAMAVQTDFARVFANPFETPHIQRIALRLESRPERHLATIEGAWSDKMEAAPGEALTIKVMLRPYRGDPIIRDVPITIPEQAAHGSTMQVLVSDAGTLDRRTAPFGAAVMGRLTGLEQLIALLNRARRNDRLYVALLDANPTLLVQDKVMPNAPLSEINVIDGRPGQGAGLLLHDSAAGEWSVPMDEVITGYATVAIHIP